MVRVKNKHTALCCGVQPGAVGMVTEGQAALFARSGLLVAVEPPPPPPAPEAVEPPPPPAPEAVEPPPPPEPLDINDAPLDHPPRKRGRH